MCSVCIETETSNRDAGKPNVATAADFGLASLSVFQLSRMSLSQRELQPKAEVLVKIWFRKEVVIVPYEHLQHMRCCLLTLSE